MSEERASIDLPGEARALLVAVAAGVLENLPVAQVPPSLVAVRRFTPRKRRSAGAEPLLRAMESDQGFRGEVRRQWAQINDLDQESVTGIDQRAIGLFLEQPPGWAENLREIYEASAPATAAPQPAQLRDELAKERARTAQLTQRLIEVTEQRVVLDEQLGGLRRENRKLRSAADRARAQAREANAVLERSESELAGQLAHLKARAEEREAVIARLNAEVEQLRLHRGRDSEIATARARLLMDTVVDAATGLRRELALPATSLRPGDLADGHDPWQAEHSRLGSMGQDGEGPNWLDQLLSIPHLHLIVDGYNVSKEAFAKLPLAEQRSRLVAELSGIAARFSIEITCVFDGAPVRGWIPSPSTRRVRVRFSSGEIADDLIRRIVANEPPGRALAVVTSDGEIIRDVSIMGAYTVKSIALTRKMTHRSI